MGRLDEFYRQHPEQAPQPPVMPAFRAAQHYGRRTGTYNPNVHPGQFARTEVNPRLGAQIGAAYQNLPDYDPQALPSFKQFREETGRQFEHLTSRRRGGLGLDVQVAQQDPYKNPGDMMTDVREGRLKVFSSAATGGHPYLTDDENNMFRAVHDVFGHAATGSGFSRHGEESAWQHHREMFSPKARPAMTSETRGQNSAFIFALGGKEFPTQKVATLPSQLTEPSGRRSRTLHTAQFGIQKPKQFTLGG